MDGVTIAWDEAKPANTDQLGQGDDQFRSDKTALRSALNDEHNFPSTGGANTGYHRLGSARIFHGVNISTVSSTGTEGRLMFADSPGALFYLSATTRQFVGSVAGLSGNDDDGFFNATYHAPKFQCGDVTTSTSDATAIVTYDSSFSGLPYTLLTPQIGTSFFYVAKVLYASKASMTIQTADMTGVAQTGVKVNYMSIGSRSYQNL